MVESAWNMRIERITNGYIVVVPSDIDNGVPVDAAVVIEDNDKDVLKSGEKLLREVMEYFNFGGSKHDAERLRIVRDKKEE